MVPYGAGFAPFAHPPIGFLLFFVGFFLFVFISFFREINIKAVKSRRATGVVFQVYTTIYEHSKYDKFESFRLKKFLKQAELVTLISTKSFYDVTL